MIMNNFNFQIETSAISSRKLIQQQWTTIQSDELLDGYFSVDTITYGEFKIKYPIDFNTLVLDCEGAFYYILNDYPEILNGINLITIENDYTNIVHEKFMRDKLIENNFKLVYCKNICNELWNNKLNFFEVYKKY